MRWSDIPFSPPPRTLRQFAALCLAVFGGLSLWQALARGNAMLAVVFAAAALSIGPLGLFRPQTVRWVYVGWMVAAFPIGWTISQLLLLVFYFGILTPVAIVFRLAGRDPLCRREPKNQATYWVEKPTSDDVRSYFRQS
jgi:saxitoxin biosynthesis operon SxtJ-like protein